MNVLLYRHSLRLTSGAGQLIHMQARGLRAGGHRVRVACRRGGASFFLRTGFVPRYVTRSAERRLGGGSGGGRWSEAGGFGSGSGASGALVVDHSMRLPRAGLVFVHNLASEALRFMDRSDLAGESAREAAFFAALRVGVPIVANSMLVGAALVRHFGLAAERVLVHYPGFDSARFTADRAAALRAPARAALGVDPAAPLVGFVTSGDFDKRGLDVFLASAERIGAARPDARFLVVGSKRLPEWAARHALFAGGRALYRPKSREPERWLAALDLFLYAARFEEFGLVVSEAQACGVPVVTSRRVGAAECLPPAYERWLVEAPDDAALAQRALALLEDEAARRELSAAGIARAASLDGRGYVDATIATIEAATAAAAGIAAASGVGSEAEA